MTNHGLQALLQHIQTPLATAVTEIQTRQQDSSLRDAIEEFLSGDIPKHFDNTSPIFYLSRYLATPDAETLNYHDQVQDYGWPIVVGEDNQDIFTTHSGLKRNLLKLPIIQGYSKDNEAIVEYLTIADFNTQQGKSIQETTLLNGMTMTNFHHQLCQKFLPSQIQVIDESDWVNRHSRGSLVALYECLLPLFLVHGIMLELYEPGEEEFIETVVIPAWETTKKRFGYSPLIAPLTLQYSKQLPDLNSYTAEVGAYAKQLFTIHQKP